MKIKKQPEKWRFSSKPGRHLFAHQSEGGFFRFYLDEFQVAAEALKNFESKSFSDRRNSRWKSRPSWVCKIRIWMILNTIEQGEWKRWTRWSTVSGIIIIELWWIIWNSYYEHIQISLRRYSSPVSIELRPVTESAASCSAICGSLGSSVSKQAMSVGNPNFNVEGDE